MTGYVRKVKALSQVARNSRSRLDKLIALNALNSVVMSSAISPAHLSDETHLSDGSQFMPEDFLITKFYIREKSNQILPNELPDQLSLRDPDYLPSKDQMMSWEKMYTKSPYIGKSIQILPKPIDFLDLSMGVSFMSSIYNKTVASIDSSPMEFVKTMQGIHTNHIIRTKDESILFNGVKYKTEQSRALTNTDYASLVVVDIDDGDLSPKQFRDIFSDQYPHSFFMCNSYSRSVEKPNNYRAVFFIKQVVNDDIYRDVQTYLQNILKRCGYITCWPKDREKHLSKDPNAKFSGMDLSKNHTASFFYIPCKVQDRLEWAFFWRCNLKDLTQLRRYAIDVENVIQYQAEPIQQPQLVFESTQNTTNTPAHTHRPGITEEGFIDYQAIKAIIKAGDYKHLGEHYSYGRMAASMKEAGFTEADFIELTPYISQSKTANDARQYWAAWGQYRTITRGTMFYLLGLNQTA